MIVFFKIETRRGRERERGGKLRGLVCMLSLPAPASDGIEWRWRNRGRVKP